MRQLVAAIVVLSWETTTCEVAYSLAGNHLILKLTTLLLRFLGFNQTDPYLQAMPPYHLPQGALGKRNPNLRDTLKV